MKRQIVERISMLVVLGTITLATAVVSAHGQSTHRLTAHVPFDFIAGEKILTAGDYTVGSMTADRSEILIRNVKTGQSEFRLTNTVEPKRGEDRARLVFHRYGQTYFLAEVWRGNLDSGSRLIQSKQERAMNRESTTLARNKYETVELLATLR
jgi:hypothetical protein